MDRLFRRGPLNSCRLMPTRAPLLAAMILRSRCSWSKADAASTVVTGGAGFEVATGWADWPGGGATVGARTMDTLGLAYAAVPTRISRDTVSG